MILVEKRDLVAGVLLQRYKRFLADVRLEDGQVVTAHCTNTGSMATCWEAGDRVLLERAPVELEGPPWLFQDGLGRARHFEQQCPACGRVLALVQAPLVDGDQGLAILDLGI